MLLIIYNQEKILNVIDALEAGTTYSTHYLLKATEEDAKGFFELKGFDTTKIDEYEPIKEEV